MVVITVCVATILVLLVLESGAPLYRQPSYVYEQYLLTFDRQAWVSGKSHGVGGPYLLRRRMIGDLLRNHLRVGMTRDDIVDLLGKPRQENDKKLDYYLGYPKWTFTFDHDIFIIHLNSDRKAASFEVCNT
ncbi:MAG: hypothetical protein AB7O38_09335 [Pirellulaceae bacterium]